MYLLDYDRRVCDNCIAACPPNHIQHQNSCYRVLPMNVKMYNSSNMFELHTRDGVCRNQASWTDTGHLATISSEEQNTFYRRLGMRCMLRYSLLLMNTVCSENFFMFPVSSFLSIVLIFVDIKLVMFEMFIRYDLSDSKF